MTHNISAKSFFSRLSPNKKDVDMTEGSIIWHLIIFAIPLMAGNLFQQMYNMVDAWVVGNYVSNEAFSAVGTVGPITNTLIGFFGGLATGAGVVISQNFGAKQYDEVKKAVHTAVAATLIFGVILTFVGLAASPAFLQLMKIPDEVYPESYSYLTIYFSGLISLMIYNMGAAILRAIGDSKRPFYFLVVCALVNTALDLLFVLIFHMGVEGVALATVLAQTVSAVLVIITLIREKNCVQLHVRQIRIHPKHLKSILAIGIPTGIQLGITALSNVFVLSYITYFGADCMSGWAAHGKVNQLLFLPVQAISMAATTFVAQNLGSGQIKRCKKGATISILLAIGMSTCIIIPIMLFAPDIVRFFNKKPEVVKYGAQILRWVTPFFFCCCFNQVHIGALRGVGNSRAPMIMLLVSFVVVRQIYLLIVSRVCNTLFLVALSFPVGWACCTLVTTIYYHAVQFNTHRAFKTHA